MNQLCRSSRQLYPSRQKHCSLRLSQSPQRHHCFAATTRFSTIDNQRNLYKRHLLTVFSSIPFEIHALKNYRSQLHFPLAFVSHCTTSHYTPVGSYSVHSCVSDVRRHRRSLDNWLASLTRVLLRLRSVCPNSTHLDRKPNQVGRSVYPL